MRLWKPSKSIFDYEKCVPSGPDSYWNLSPTDRTAKKLPRAFDRKTYNSMKDKLSGDRAVNLGEILIDSSATTLHGFPIPVSSSDEQDIGVRTVEQENVTDFLSLSDVDNVSIGKKRSRSTRVAGLRKDFQDCTKQLIHIIDNVEKDRTRTQRYVMEISRSEFKTSIKLQQERIVAAQQSSEALMEIASALKPFNSGFGPGAQI